ncbi:stimulated by retinoic acid gene 6 protein-like [Mya arenaria]|uniref:stimulated by retinoic acid gene 6 protein-like n=1 Tax=Mya arenaria TaxID=6604 RepID=UPI0022E77D09|nr:stimulated by retinoic acid gene 6 protein-like [Mya arenaria]
MSLKNLTNSTLNETQTVDCGSEGLEYLTSLLVFLSVIPSVIILSVLSLLEKRTSCLTNVCYSRPGVARPLRFLDERRNKWGIVFGFGSLTSIVLQYIMVPLGNPQSAWEKVLWSYLSTIVLSLAMYPVFACLTTPHRLAGGILGLLYSLLWLAMQIFCTFVRWSVDVCLTQNSAVKHFEYLIPFEEIPTLVFSVLVVLKFCWKLVQTLKTRSSKVETMCTKKQRDYVKHLIAKISENNASIQQTISDAFDLSMPILIGVVSAAVVTYQVVVEAFGLTYRFLQEWSDQSDFEQLIKYIFGKYLCASSCAVLVVIVIAISNSYYLIKSYRRHIKMLHSGDRSFLPKSFRNCSPAKYQHSSTRFVGYFMIGAFYNTLINYIILSVALFCTIAILDLARQEHLFMELLSRCDVLVYPVIAIVIIQIQIVLVKKLFVSTEDGAEGYLINNRKAFDVVSFFMLFLNAGIGVFAYFKRIATGAGLGLFLLGRMDTCLLMSGFESFDICYGAYIGMIVVDATNNNPAMRVFCDLIYETIQNKKLENPAFQLSSGRSKYPNRIRTKWLLAFTLARNKSLLKFRKEKVIDSNHQLGVNLSIQNNEMTETQSIGKIARFTGFCKQISLPEHTVTYMALVVVGFSGLIIYTGGPILIKRLF